MGNEAFEIIVEGKFKICKGSFESPYVKYLDNPEDTKHWEFRTEAIVENKIYYGYGDKIEDALNDLGVGIRQVLL